MKGKIFISYSRVDGEKALQLYDLLAKSSFLPWIDVHDLELGQRWEEAIHKEIAQSDIYIACMSKEALSKRGYLQKELRLAYEEALRVPEDDVYIIPLLFDDCEELIPYKLRQFNYAKYVTSADKASFVQRLTRYFNNRYGNQSSAESAFALIEQHKSIFEDLEKREIIQYFSKELEKDPKNHTLKLLSSYANMKSTDLTSSGSLLRNEEKINRWLSDAVKLEEIKETALFAWALLKHDYFEHRHRVDQPSSSQLLAELKKSTKKPNGFLIKQLKPSRKFTLKTRILL